MPQKYSNWSRNNLNTISSLKKFLANVSVGVRSQQYKTFELYMHPTPKISVLDIGTTTDEVLKDSNFFEKRYPFKNNLTVASIEDCSPIVKKYKLHSFVKISADKKLPFNDKTFDVVTSWATLEHVGGYSKQANFIHELLRVGKRVFITTPYRGCIYEPHSEIFFLHWLPLPWFRNICALLGKSFWATEENLNPLWARDIYNLVSDKSIRVIIFRTFGILPSHLLIYKI